MNYLSASFGFLAAFDDDNLWKMKEVTFNGKHIGLSFKTTIKRTVLKHILNAKYQHVSNLYAGCTWTDWPDSLFDVCLRKTHEVIFLKK